MSSKLTQNHCQRELFTVTAPSLWIQELLPAQMELLSKSLFKVFSSIYPSIIRLSTHPSKHPSISPSICSSTIHHSASIRLSINPSVHHPSVHPSFSFIHPSTILLPIHPIPSMGQEHCWVLEVLKEFAATVILDVAYHRKTRKRRRRKKRKRKRKKEERKEGRKIGRQVGEGWRK